MTGYKQSDVDQFLMKDSEKRLKKMSTSTNKNPSNEEEKKDD